ncbi:hypothetical protein EGI31_14035 [Lacihabitans soyangensis]|uniref:Uncharacterized protein n=1 Tax=Lacihabitans soyangensis TaxID=869394 RepID=A0AAE3H4W0_9BACT|nr:hypothetical protein [Lacihabitans soyangensis]
MGFDFFLFFRVNFMLIYKVLNVNRLHDVFVSLHRQFSVFFVSLQRQIKVVIEQKTQVFLNGYSWFLFEYIGLSYKRNFRVGLSKISIRFSSKTRK